MPNDELLNGWVPYRLLADENGSIQFRWLYIGEHAFTEPFFEESVAACLSLPQNIPGKFPVTSAETLIQLAKQCEAVAPTAFIYHISRCGSTLLSQLLSCDAQNTVLSEVPLLDEILRMPNAAKEKYSTEELFKAALRLLGRKRMQSEQRLFVKTDSWHVLFYKQLHAWFPDTPSFLMYRAPEEVGASQANHPAMHSVPGVIAASLFGLADEEAMHMTRGSYLDHVLACYLGAYIEIMKSDRSSTALSYHNGVVAMTGKIANVCDFVMDENTVRTMEKRAGFHSKSPEKNFSGDTHASSGWDEFVKSKKKFAELEQLIANRKTTLHES